MKQILRTIALAALLCTSISHAAYDATHYTVVTLKRGSGNVTTSTLTEACAEIPN